MNTKKFKLWMTIATCKIWFDQYSILNIDKKEKKNNHEKYVSQPSSVSVSHTLTLVLL